MNDLPVEAWDRLFRIADISLTFSCLVAFIVATYFGRVMYPREFKVLTDVNTRLAAAVAEAAKTTQDALKALAGATEAHDRSVQRFDDAIKALKDVEIALENQRRENAIINQRRRT